ncbi:MAG: biotin--[acetyl-CoA-carboxylase] ligase [Alphaproteobacteria bacterium]|nr:biotin--[acetyl-CoA-carboxylase] ligase [Alphaproteobacteria bacterium]MDE1986829.1 biotin--[acetyl-CoA-carboxylase] ligase [Alphaproteobacteria bacterium]MDE2163522.1 biotin--[acetyl-CoA-carboxylase] ligase [Alphaproteobacteria bacterium]MDE2267056.1 biotin--[acetyl-CoA-carboxylase] ligase [Alphaproteobacteria bacterium]MDE2499320.1 biotin--[acetyl-CoA-carboxylase] ligase [Alphaproteobacteria bacterium]
MTAAAWPAGYALLEFDEIDSTNEEARRRAAAGASTPLWITAARQSAGRGRRGRVWDSASGNLFATLLLRPNKPAGECAQLSFVAALAVSDMLAAFAPAADLKLKWPNDVLASGRKLAGILLESESRPDGKTAWLAVGIGVNLAMFPEDTEFPATSLKALGVTPPQPRDALLHLAAAFAKWYEAWRMGGFGPVREAWLARASGLGSRIRARLANEEIIGVFQGIDDSGALLLGLPGGTTRIIAAGEVFFG